METVIKKRAKKSKNYFTQDTEAAILKFVAEEDAPTRSRIFRDELQYPFFKLTQNIIHTFKFYHTEDNNLENLQHEVTTFLMTKFHLFDPTRGAKAYSYFGTIAKRWLIANSNQVYKKKIETYSLDDLTLEDESGLGVYNELIDATHDYDSQYLHATDQLSDFMDAYVEYYYANLEKIFTVAEEMQIADVLLNLFKSRQELPIITKKAIYIYVREQIDTDTAKITKISKVLAKYFKDSYQRYMDTGTIRFTL